jgi:hypothetical protein
MAITSESGNSNDSVITDVKSDGSLSTSEWYPGEATGYNRFLVRMKGYITCDRIKFDAGGSYCDIHYGLIRG